MGLLGREGYRDEFGHGYGMTETDLAVVRMESGMEQTTGDGAGEAESEAGSDDDGGGGCGESGYGFGCESRLEIEEIVLRSRWVRIGWGGQQPWKEKGGRVRWVGAYERTEMGGMAGWAC
ncbi:hypothetical protein C1H46_044397 [Malus baccata]|uniref:Uncharacterized protein n=1 Tax=Malus baccata TaxID=106549 RepID=A0A540K782_MALBA|nr:hypothetical protein C1H46_044397 [Malus baccata]